MSKELEKAMLRIKRAIERKASQELKPLLKAYQDSLRNVQGELAQLTSKHTKDGKLSFSDAQRYSVLYKLEKSIIEQANNIGQLELTSTTNVLQDSYESSYYRTFYEIDRGLSIASSFALLQPHMVERAVRMPLNGSDYSDRIWKNKEGMIKRLRGVLQRSLIEGKDPTKLARELSQAYGTSAYESTRLVQNEVARATTQASQDVYRRSGVVPSVMFNATLDGATTDTCEELDGKIYPLGTEPSIPDDTHIGCRSVLIPVVEGWDPSQRKDNITKEVIPYQNYSDWAKDKGIN